MNPRNKHLKYSSYVCGRGKKKLSRVVHNSRKTPSDVISFLLPHLFVCFFSVTSTGILTLGRKPWTGKHPSRHILIITASDGRPDGNGVSTLLGKGVSKNSTKELRKSYSSTLWNDLLQPLICDLIFFSLGKSYLKLLKVFFFLNELF